MNYLLPPSVVGSEIARIATLGPFQPEWDSLKAYTVPDWYADAKFGIFLHWGIYSVPAFGNEWYPREMYKPGTKVFEHHVDTYGPQTDFGYKDFVPDLHFDDFDPQAYASLFIEAGAKFVVPVAEHHDGFSMGHTDLSEWCATRRGPMRDAVGELAEAVREQGIAFGVSSHRAEHFWFFDGGRSFPSDVQNAAFDSLYGPAQAGPTDHQSRTENPPTPEFLDDWLARTCELVDRYRPQIVWFDWWINNLAFEPYLRKFAAYYYNRAAEWGVEVAINYKYDAFPEGTAVFDVERGQLSGIRAELWQNDTSLSKSSWGYIENQDYKTVDSLIDDLVDIVSKNGVLLLNIGPKADGTIPVKEQEILREIGAWLKINGEAIYGTRPWRIFGEGPTEVDEGAFTDTKRAAFTGQDIRFTSKGDDNLYAIALAWPGETMTIASLALGSASAGDVEISDVMLLGCTEAVHSTRDTNGLHVQMPDAQPCEHAFVLHITLKTVA